MKNIQTNPNNPPLKIDTNFVRDEKIYNYTLLGWSKVRIAEELGLHRSTVAMVINSIHGQKRLSEAYESIDQAMVGIPELVGLATQQLKSVLEGGCSDRKSKTIIDAARLVFGIAVKFKELDRGVVKTVSNVNLYAHDAS